VCTENHVSAKMMVKAAEDINREVLEQNTRALVRALNAVGDRASSG
jgi:hypothetical protein